MTREEAIKELSYIADEMPSMECADWKEAISMAIEVLQQEPTYTSEIAQKAYEDGKKDGYTQRKIETINEQETKKEHWIIDGHHRRCPKCNEYFCIKDAEGSEIPSSFCPNCGAYMREEQE